MAHPGLGWVLILAPFPVAGKPVGVQGLSKWSPRRDAGARRNDLAIIRVLLGITGAFLAAQTGLLRPRLDRRAGQIITGQSPP